jgi:hypothetical protein
VAEEPGKIGVTSIGAERNAEVRRVMIERYRYGEEISGAAAYVRDSEPNASTMMSVSGRCIAGISPEMVPGWS